MDEMSKTIEFSLSVYDRLIERIDVIIRLIRDTGGVQSIPRVTNVISGNDCG